jgi:hypothetical protein
MAKPSYADVAKGIKFKLVPCTCKAPTTTSTTEAKDVKAEKDLAALREAEKNEALEGKKEVKERAAPEMQQADEQQAKTLATKMAGDKGKEGGTDAQPGTTPAPTEDHGTEGGKDAQPGTTPAATEPTTAAPTKQTNTTVVELPLPTELIRMLKEGGPVDSSIKTAGDHAKTLKTTGSLRRKGRHFICQNLRPGGPRGSGLLKDMTPRFIGGRIPGPPMNPPRSGIPNPGPPPPIIIGCIIGPPRGPGGENIIPGDLPGPPLTLPPPTAEGVLGTLRIRSGSAK